MHKHTACLLDVLRDVDGLRLWQGVQLPVGGQPEVRCRRWSPGLVAAVEDLVVR